MSCPCLCVGCGELVVLGGRELEAPNCCSESTGEEGLEICGGGVENESCVSVQRLLALLLKEVMEPQ